MKLDLRKIIDTQGSEIPFEFELETDNLTFPSVIGYRGKPFCEGRVYNEAGVIHLSGTVDADMICTCDRCGTEFESNKVTEVEVVLVEENPDDDEKLFVVEGFQADLDEIFSTCFILDMETKFLCREDCDGAKEYERGNEIDPRFAVLQQLLDK